MDRPKALGGIVEEGWQLRHEEGENVLNHAVGIVKAGSARPKNMSGL